MKAWLGGLLMKLFERFGCYSTVNLDDNIPSLELYAPYNAIGRAYTSIIGQAFSRAVKMHRGEHTHIKVNIKLHDYH